MDRQVFVVVLERVVEVDHALDEGRREHADAAEIEQVDRIVFPRRIVAEMRVAVDHAVIVERHIPGAEHGARQRVAGLDRCVLERGQLLPVEPAHGQQPAGRQVRHDRRDMDGRLVAQHVAVERHMRRLARVIEFLEQAGGEFLVDVAGVDRAVVAGVEAEDHPQLPEVRGDDRRHVRILQLAGDGRAVLQGRPVDLAEGCGRRSLALESPEPALPVGAQLARHAPAHEGPAHRRRIALQLRQFPCVFARQRLRHGRQELRHLHQRSLEAAQGGAQLGGVAFAVDPDAEIALAGHPGGQPADGAARRDIAADPPAQIAGIAHAKKVGAAAGAATPGLCRCANLRRSARGGVRRTADKAVTGSRSG